ncbi:MAG: DNA polymerase III subunit delta' [Patescibacteria group bacterium]|jgi:DNA polymerase-3 subunit delta'
MSQEIIGHEKVLTFLEKSLKNGRLSNAYLFVGPDGVGKTAVAEWLIKKVSGPSGFEHPDVSLVNRLVDEKTDKIKSEIVVKQIRELRERLSMSGFLGGHKFAFIEEAETLNTEASNALLKTLEEPAEDTTLILCATSPDRLLATIVSRCQIIRFTPVPREKIVGALMGRGVVRVEAEAIAALSSGRPGYALRLLRDEETRSLEETSVQQFIEIIDSPVSARLTRAATWLPKDETNKKEQLKNLLDRWEWLLRDVFLLSSNIDDLAARATAYPDLSRLAKTKQTDHWSNALATLREIKNDLAFNVNPTLALEHLFLKL